MPFSKYDIVYDTKTSLENDIGARTFDNDKSAPDFTSFQIGVKCTIKQPVYFYLSSSNFQNIASNNARMRRLPSLISKFSQHFQL